MSLLFVFVGTDAHFQEMRQIKDLVVGKGDAIMCSEKPTIVRRHKLCKSFGRGKQVGEVLGGILL